MIALSRANDIKYMELLERQPEFVFVLIIIIVFSLIFITLDILFYFLVLFLQVTDALELARRPFEYRVCY